MSAVSINICLNPAEIKSVHVNGFDWIARSYKFYLQNSGLSYASKLFACILNKAGKKLKGLNSTRRTRTASRRIIKYLLKCFWSFNWYVTRFCFILTVNTILRNVEQFYFVLLFLESLTLSASFNNQFFQCASVFHLLLFLLLIFSPCSSFLLLFPPCCLLSWWAFSC